MKSKILAVSFALVLAACGHQANFSTRSAGGNSPAAGGVTLVAAGTQFYGKLQQRISTKTSHDGDTFTLVQTDTLLHKDAQLHGSSIEGHLENVQPAGTGRKPSLTLVFDNVRMADGSTAPVDVKLESFKTFEPHTHHLRTIGMMIGGAFVGHEVSKHTGKGHGATMGAAGAYMLSQTMKTDITVPAGTVIEVKFQRPATKSSG